MSKFHVNPKTGSPSLCRATEKRGCPYSGVSEHFSSAEEARADYERVQQKIEWFMNKSEVPLAKGAVVLFTYDYLDSDVPLPLKDTPIQNQPKDPVMTEFIERMDKAPDGTVIVSGKGLVFQKRTLNGAYGNSTWAMRTPYEPTLHLEQNQSYHSSAFLGRLKIEGARIELPGKEFYPGVTYMEEFGRNE